MEQRTLILLKPDALQRGLAGQIIGRIEGRGLKIVGLKLVQMDMKMAGEHYSAHADKPFFKGLAAFMTSSPLIAMAVEGKNAVEIMRNTMGTTDPEKAAPGTIRGDLGVDIGRNLIHGSDSIEAANRELGIFFKGEELLSYKKDMDGWVTES